MGIPANDHRPDLVTVRGAHERLGRAAVPVRLALVLAGVALVGCSTGTVETGQPSATGGHGVTMSSGGTGVVTTGGTIGSSGGSPGSGGGGAGSAVGSGGTSNGTGGGFGSGGAAAGTGGALTTVGTGGSNGSTGGSNSGGRGGGTTTTGTGGGAGAGSSGSGGSTPLPPPVRDTASKIPLSSASGYTVEGNYAYGPLPVQRLDVIYPAGAGPRGTKVLPAVLMFHGGAWIHGYQEANGKDHMSTFYNRFLAHGFIVFNAEYRVNNGTSEGAPAPAAVQDALLAAKWCWDYLDYFHGDKSKYVVTGASAGGHLALMVGMTTPAAKLGATSPGDYFIAAIVDGYGPADIESELSGVAEGWIPASLPNRAAIAKQVNPMTYVRKEIPPLIVVQGSEDNVAPVAHSVRLVNNLKAVGADATMHEVPGAGHGYTTVPDGWTDAEKAMFDWLVARGIGK